MTAPTINGTRYPQPVDGLLPVRRGDRLVWEHPDWPVPLHIAVVRVARDGTWADIDVTMCDAQWSRRTPLPLPSRCRPDNSTVES